MWWIYAERMEYIVCFLWVRMKRDDIGAMVGCSEEREWFIYWLQWVRMKRDGIADSDIIDKLSHECVF